MDVQALIQKYGPALIEQLVAKSGFSTSQAQSFLPALIEKVVSAVQGGGVNLQSLAGGDIGALLSKLDLGALAKTAGVDKAKAEAGARQVLPELVKAVSSSSGGLEGLLGKLGDAGGGAQDLLKKAGKMFGAS